MFSYDDCLTKSTDYFSGDDLAAKVFVDKYALRDFNDNLLEQTPEDMHRRLAREFARIERGKFKTPLTEDEIFNLFDKFRYIVPQGSPMTGIGNPYHIMSISNCFVIESPLDSYGGIHRTDEQLSQISKRRGGTGLDISFIRPEGALTNNSSKTSTGTPPFMERFSNSIREVGQGGRRGALMMTISIHHPDVLKFARSKLDRTKITGANISIRLSDEFLNAVQADKEYEQRWPVDSKNPTISKMVSARETWLEIIKCAHEMAEPGLLFWDNIIRESPADCYYEFGFRTVCTNPCSELPLSVLDSCRLLLLNLFSFVINPFTKNAVFDFSLFYEYAKIAQRLMDDLVDLELEQIQKIIDKILSDPEPLSIKQVELDTWYKIKSNCERGRRTGLGITALADTLAALGIKYGSRKSIDIVDSIYKTLKFGAYRSSVDMAKELGPFPIWNAELEKDNPFLNRIKEETCSLKFDKNTNIGTGIFGWDIFADMQRYGRRNISLLTTPPAGSVSIETQTTSGIEPLFLILYLRRKKVNHNEKNANITYVDKNGDSWEEFEVYHPKVKMWMHISGEKDVTKSPWYGCCAEDLDWKQRVKLQSAAQKHVDHGISSTINLPENVTVEQVAEIYETAWKEGLKGVTVYRKNCRSGVLVQKDEFPKHNAPKRPNEVECDVHHVSVKGKKYFVLVGLYSGEPYEVFAGRGNLIDNDVVKGKIVKYRTNFYKAILDDETELSPVTLGCGEDEEVITRLTSGMLRHGAAVEHVIDQLLKVEGDLTSFSKAIARSLKRYIKDGTKSTEDCSTCKAKLVFQDGCLKCMSCGYSKCS